MPGWTWLQGGGGGNSPSLPPSASPHPSSLLLLLPLLARSPSLFLLRGWLRSGLAGSQLNCAFECGSCQPARGEGEPGSAIGAPQSSLRGRALGAIRASERGSERGAEPRAPGAGTGARPAAASGQRPAPGQRAECRERPGSAEAPPGRNPARRPGRRPARPPARRGLPGRAGPGWPRVRPETPSADGGGRAPLRPQPGHVSGKRGPPAARTHTVGGAAGAPSPEPERASA